MLAIEMLLLTLTDAEEVLCWGYRAAESVQAAPKVSLKQLHLWPVCIALPADLVFKTMTGPEGCQPVTEPCPAYVSRRNAGSQHAALGPACRRWQDHSCQHAHRPDAAH